MTKQRIILAAVMVLAFVNICAAAAPTPEQAVLNMRDALSGDDVDAFLACFDATETEQKMLGGLFGMAAVMREFNVKMTDAFGAEAAEDILGIQMASFGAIEAITEDKLDIEQDGDKAVCRIDDSDLTDPLFLVKKDGGWLLTLEEEDTPDPEDIDRELRLMQAMTDVFEEMGDRAGEEGMTPDAFEEELGQKMMAAMFAVEEEPDDVPSGTPTPPTVRSAVPTDLDIEPATTPEQAILNMRNSLLAGDEEAFVSCFAVDENGDKMLRAMFSMVDIMKDFSEKVQAAFGDDAASILDSQADPFAELAAITPEDLQIAVADDGNSATCLLEGSDMDEMPLVKKDGLWLIAVTEDEAPSAEEVEQALKMVEIMSNVFEEMGNKAGDKGMTPEKFEEEMGQMMMQAMFAAMAEMEPEDFEEEDDSEHPEHPEDTEDEW